MWGLARQLTRAEVGDILVDHQARLRSPSYDTPPVFELRAADRAIRRHRWSRDSLVYDETLARQRRGGRGSWDDEAPF